MSSSIASQPINSGVSVVVCCHNSARKLPATLLHLSKQLTQVNWEIIIVDNNSSDNTASLALSFWNGLNTQNTIRIVTEPKPGLTNARIKGVQAAQFDLILFCDDDNWLAEDYVDKAYRLMTTERNIGILGGIGVGEFEGEVPRWVKGLLRLFAVGVPLSATGVDIRTAYGAGMIVKKEIFSILNRLNYQLMLSDRIGTQLSSGGDTELCLLAQVLGFKVCSSDALSFSHFIPVEKMRSGYINNILQNNAKSESMLLPYFLFLRKKRVNGFYYSGYIIKAFMSGILKIILGALFFNKANILMARHRLALSRNLWYDYRNFQVNYDKISNFYTHYYSEVNAQ